MFQPRSDTALLIGADNANTPSLLAEASARRDKVKEATHNVAMTAGKMAGDEIGLGKPGSSGKI